MDKLQSWSLMRITKIREQVGSEAAQDRREVAFYLMRIACPRKLGCKGTPIARQHPRMNGTKRRGAGRRTLRRKTKGFAPVAGGGTTVPRENVKYKRRTRRGRPRGGAVASPHGPHPRARRVPHRKAEPARAPSRERTRRRRAHNVTAVQPDAGRLSPRGNECIPSAELRVAKLSSLCPAPLRSCLLRDAGQGPSQCRWAPHGRGSTGSLPAAWASRQQQLVPAPACVVATVLSSPEPAHCVLENQRQLAGARPPQDPPSPSFQILTPPTSSPLAGPWAASPPAGTFPDVPQSSDAY